MKTANWFNWSHQNNPHKPSGKGIVALILMIIAAIIAYLKG